MSGEKRFCYRTFCSVIGCDDVAIYKIAAAWSDGTSRELKNYGLACETHRVSLLEEARRHHQDLRLSEGETVGPVGLYELLAGRRDSELARIKDPSDRDSQAID